MKHGRRFLFLLTLASAGAAFAACGGRAASPVVAPMASSTSIPAPSATAASVTVGSGSNVATVVVPPLTGATQGSTVTVTATSTRPAAIPSAAPQSSMYVSVTFPAGATSAKAPTLSVPPGSLQWAYGTVSMANAVAAPAIRTQTRRPSYASVVVLYDPENVNASALQLTFTNSAWMGFEDNTTLAWSSPDTIDEYDGQQQDVDFHLGGGSGPANSANWLAFLNGPSASSLAPLIHVSTSACSANSPTCFHLKLSTTSPGPYANGISHFLLLFLNEPYLAFVDVPTAANPNPTPTPAALQTSNFTFNTSMNEMVSGTGGTVPVFGSGFYSANISLPGTTQNVGPATLTATTSIAPIASTVSSALQTGHSFINAVDFTFPNAITFGSAPGFTADFCFAQAAAVPMTLWRYYGTSAPLSMGSAQPASDPVNCPNALYPYHLAEPTQLDGVTINANDHFGYVLTAP